MNESLRRHEWTVESEAAGARLDAYLASRLDGVSRSRIEAWIDAARVRVDGRTPKPSLRLRGGEQVLVEPPAPRPSDLPAQEMPLSVLYEDPDFLALDKPAGLVVHPSPGHPDRTLVNGLLARLGVDLQAIGDAARPGIVHRLDKDTTGVLVVAKSERGFRALTEQFQQRTMKKTYLALVHGRFAAEQGDVNRPIGRHRHDRKRMAVIESGRTALTRWRVRQRFASATLLEVELVTGRTHQIRVHLAAIGHAIVGDPVYGLRTHRVLAFARQALHAWRIELARPGDGARISIEAPIPQDMAALLAKLGHSQA